MARLGGWLVVVQDDANFLAFIDAKSGEARAVPLPPGDDGRRQFDDGRGNKHLKLDLEACFTAPGEDGEPVLVALGSGSSPRRERILVAEHASDPDRCQVRVVDAAPLYAALRADPGFAPGELNVEGAVHVDGEIRLFGRGNGAARNGASSSNATCELAWTALRAFLADPATVPPPALEHAQQYTLGVIDGLALGFTDAAAGFGPNTILFAAAAEDSPDATRDGRVAGSALGVLQPGRTPRWTILQTADGQPFAAKVEGLLTVPGQPRTAQVVIDQDDPDTPSELCDVELAGDWGG
jgi:hypothetical protein